MSTPPPATVTENEGAVTAELAGELDMAATFTAEPALERAMELPQLESFTLDLSDVSFIDSTGMGLVLRVANDLQGRGVPLRILPGPRPVHQVFESTGVADALPFEPPAPG
jgi:stage II sporulation protein AA (anti-sigma F factor antagonist)